MAKWFCRICWRNGELEFGDRDLADAQAKHLKAVNAGLNPQNTPNPTKFPANHPLMEKYPGVYCPGDVHFGETTKRQRFKAEANLLFE